MAYGGEAKFMGVMRSRDDQKRSYDPYKFSKSRAPNKKVQNMLNQVIDFELVIKTAFTFDLTS